MAYSYSYHATTKIIQVVQSGIANCVKETLHWMMAVRTDKRFGSEYGILCDFREGSVQISSNDAFTCGTIISYFFPKQKIAFVIPDILRSMVVKQALAVQRAAELRSFSRIYDG